MESGGFQVKDLIDREGGVLGHEVLEDVVEEDLQVLGWRRWEGE